MIEVASYSSQELALTSAAPASNTCSNTAENMAYAGVATHLVRFVTPPDDHDLRRGRELKGERISFAARVRVIVVDSFIEQGLAQMYFGRSMDTHNS